MYMTVFSTLQAILTSNLLICLCAFIMKRKKLLYKLPYNTVVLLLLLAMVRLLFPVYFRDFGFHITFYEKSMQFLSYPSRCDFQAFGFYFSVFDVFCTVWGAGVLFMAFRYVRKETVVNRYIARFAEDVTEKAPYASVMKDLTAAHRRGNIFKIYRISGISTPFIRGVIRPVIMLPAAINFEEKELYYVLAHEVSHYRHLDTLTKQLLQLTSIVFWWNPACHTLNRQADLMFELRVDHTVTGSDKGTMLEYLQCILNVAEQACEANALPECMYIGFAKKEDTGMLTKRVHYLVEKSGKPKKAAAALILSVAFLLYASSTLLAFQVEDYDNYNIYFTLTPENSYIIEKENGEYDIYLLDRYIQTVTSLMGYDTSIPVYQEK